MALDAAPDTLERRLARWRAAHAAPAAPGRAGPGRPAREDRDGRADALAEALDGSVVREGGARIVRIERPSFALPVDRERLTWLPGQPPHDVPLVCLDTETTGLGTATGTLAFLIGLGWWEADRFRQVQLVLPDHADEPLLLDLLARTIPATGWLVTYNGRGFDWPLLETRYRMGRTAAPAHAGHLDLLPFVRRVFRHRLPDARLRSVERHVLGVHRIGDVDGWEIPGRYLDVLRGASPELLGDVVHHNHLDVRSLAQVVALIAAVLADPAGRSAAHPGDLAGIARLLRRQRRHADALACLDLAIEKVEDLAAPATPSPQRGRLPSDEGPVPDGRPVAGREPGPWSMPSGTGEGAVDAWWAPARRPDFGGRARERRWPEPPASPLPWTLPRMAAERARVLRDVGRHQDAVAAWSVVAAGRGREAALAWVEIAKLREHRLRDPDGALEAVARARSVLERARLVGWPDPRLERALDHRAARLRRRASSAVAAASHRSPAAAREGSGRPLVALGSASRRR